MLESKTKKGSNGGSIEAEEVKITVMEFDELVGDNLEALLDHWCGIKDTKFLYMKKAGNHLEVGKAEISCLE